MHSASRYYMVSNEVACAFTLSTQDSIVQSSLARKNKPTNSHISGDLDVFNGTTCVKLWSLMCEYGKNGDTPLYK